MGYENTAEFKSKTGTGGCNVLCMERTFGLALCPQCATAKELYAKGDAAGETFEKPGPFRTEAKRNYHQKTFQCFGIVYCEDKAQHNQICLVTLPKQQVDTVLNNVNSKNAAARWPCPDSLTEGRCLVVNKFKRTDGSDQATYSTNLDLKTAPISQEWWDKTRAALPDLDDPIAMQMAATTWGPERIFTAYADMQIGDTVLIRLLPHTRKVNAVPFTVMNTHYVQIKTPWDTAWEQFRYDINRIEEVLAIPAVRAQLAQANVDVSMYVQNIEKSENPSPTANMDELPFGMPTLDD